MEMFDRIGVAMIGVGPADFQGPLEEHDNFFNSEQLAEVRSLGAVGQITATFYWLQRQTNQDAARRSCRWRIAGSDPQGRSTYADRRGTEQTKTQRHRTC